MATKIRLMRMGAIKRPFYRLVVVDSRNRRDGRYIENLGTYNPIPKATEVTLRDERILHWLGEGAQLSGTAENLVRKAGILERFRLIEAGTPPEELESRLSEWKAKQPKAAEGTLSRTEKKAKKKTDARAEVEAAAKAEADAKAKAEAAAKTEAAAKAKAEAAAAAEPEAPAAEAEAAEPKAEG